MEIKDFEAAPAVPVSMAASMLRVSRQQIHRLLAAGDLESVPFDGLCAVTLASIKRRRRRVAAKKNHAAANPKTARLSQVTSCNRDKL